MPQEGSPPNTPSLKPVEDLWLWLKRDVYVGLEAENIKQLKRRVRKYLKEVEWVPEQKAWKSVNGKIREAADRACCFTLTCHTHR